MRWFQPIAFAIVVACLAGSSDHLEAAPIHLAPAPPKVYAQDPQSWFRPPQTARDYVERGDVYFDRAEQNGWQEWEPAITDYTKALELDPQNRHLHARRAVAHYRNGDLALAKGDRDRAVEVDGYYDYQRPMNCIMPTGFVIGAFVWAGTIATGLILGVLAAHRRQETVEKEVTIFGGFLLGAMLGMGLAYLSAYAYGASQEREYQAQRAAYLEQYWFKDWTERRMDLQTVFRR